jgi:hypothetical protein
MVTWLLGWVKSLHVSQVGFAQVERGLHAPKKENPASPSAPAPDSPDPAPTKPLQNAMKDGVGIPWKAAGGWSLAALAPATAGFAPESA